MGRDLLGPLKWRVRRERPAGGDVRLGLRAADLVELREQAGQAELDAIEARDAVDRPLEAAFGRGTVVANDVDDQRVVGLPTRGDRIDDASDLRVGVFEV